MKPIFESERIIFAEVSEAFVPGYLAMVNDYEHVNKYIGGAYGGSAHTYTEDDEIQWVRKKLEEKAPGTYNHSLTVANISERAAYAIGENPSLARAAALYHDIGKIENPEFFTENQTDGYNPHDELIPEVSVKMITRHTEAGARILSEKGFPKEIVSAAIEHHATVLWVISIIKRRISPRAPSKRRAILISDPSRRPRSMRSL